MTNTTHWTRTTLASLTRDDYTGLPLGIEAQDDWRAYEMERAIGAGVAGDDRRTCEVLEDDHEDEGEQGR